MKSSETKTSKFWQWLLQRPNLDLEEGRTSPLINDVSKEFLKILAAG
jgi:hypothetical protein